MSKSSRVIDGLKTNTLYSFHVRAKNSMGVWSVLNTVGTHTTLRDTTAPVVLSSITLLLLSGVFSLKWAKPSTLDLRGGGFKVYVFTANTPASAVLIREAGYTSDSIIISIGEKSQDASITITAGTTYFFWVTTLDASGNESAKVATTPTSGSVSAAGTGVDHGALTGLADDDHPQYAFDTDLTTHAGLSASVHGVSASGFEDKANKAVASGYASLDASVKVVQDPANATATPTQNKIPIADGVGGTLALGWLPATLTGKDADTLDTYHAASFPLLAGRAGGQTLIGGSAVTDILKLQGTSGDGTLTSPAIQLLVGNNGGTIAATVLNNGNTGFGTVSPTMGVLMAIGPADSTSTAPGVFSGNQSSTVGAGWAAQLNILNLDQTVNNWTVIGFANGLDLAAAARIGVQFTDHTSNYGDFAFLVRGTDGFLERMRITSAGIIDSLLQSGARAYLSANQTGIPQDTYIKVMLDSESYDVQSEFDVSKKSGTASATSANHLVDATLSPFVAGDVGRVVHNTTDDTYATITVFNSASDVTLSADIMVSGETYEASMSRFTVSRAGYYIISGVACWTVGMETFTTATTIRVNGATLINATQQGRSYGGAFVSDVAYLNANDYVELFCYQETGATKALYGHIGYTFLTIRKVG